MSNSNNEQSVNIADFIKGLPQLRRFPLRDDDGDHFEIPMPPPVDPQPEVRI